MTTHLEQTVLTLEVEPLDVEEAHGTEERVATDRRRLVHLALAAADTAGLVSAFLIVALAIGPIESRYGSWTELGIFGLTLPAWLAVAALYRLHSRDGERTDHTTADDAAPVFHLVTVGTWLVFTVTLLPGTGKPDLTRLVVFWGVAMGMILLARAAARSVFRRHPAFRQKTIVLGMDPVGQDLATKLLAHPECGIDIVGFVDTAPHPKVQGLNRLTLLGTPGDLPELVREHRVERVIIAFADQPLEEAMTLMRTLSRMGVQLDIVPRFYDVVSPAIDAYAVEGTPMLGLRPVRLSRSARVLKRTIDLTGSSVALVLVAPLLALIAALIKLDSPGPVFFRQARVGGGGSSFRIWKFRTMEADAEARKTELVHLNAHARNGDPRLFKIVDDPRVTRVGRFLRRHYLDEFPQLVNVIQGHMSLVGPRPLIPTEAEHVGAWARERLNLKPGMTGLWQVLGGSAISFGEMVKLDYLYVTTWSLWNDIKLLTQTVPVVFRGARAHH